MPQTPRQDKAAGAPEPRPRVPTALVATLVTGFGAGCGSEVGFVDLAWTFVDRGGSPIYPGGQFSRTRPDDSCGLPGTFDGENVPYDLVVELVACPTAPVDAACETTSFSCRRHRARVEVAASPVPYRFSARTRIEPRVAGASPCQPTGGTTCIAAPGPRERTIDEGLVTDLQVVRFDVDARAQATRAEDKLDLEECGCAL